MGLRGVVSDAANFFGVKTISENWGEIGKNCRLSQKISGGYEILVGKMGIGTGGDLQEFRSSSIMPGHPGNRFGLSGVLCEKVNEKVRDGQNLRLPLYNRD